MIDATDWEDCLIILFALAEQCIKLEDNGDGGGDNINEAMTHDHADIHNDDNPS